MKAYTTTQGTAMAETALCETHAEEYDTVVIAEGEDDWDGGPIHDCTGNDALACVICGFDGVLP